ncbi:macro domain protein [Toxoplasma gondii TgCatPRC2]|uniref:Macro domain protein n=1 Tax=Toxoplasma gondii TgCatPRC2 TaxID=1130821 RepID=A0A151H359_TOXGO|nr:macro domain protein [Toxoplasma gondii TgCatPRC2]
MEGVVSGEGLRTLMNSGVFRTSPSCSRGLSFPFVCSASHPLGEDVLPSSRNTPRFLSYQATCRRPAVAAPGNIFTSGNHFSPASSGDSSSISAGMFAQLCQRRFVRPNQGRNDYNQVGGKKRGQGVQVLPETIRLLIETRKAATAGGPVGRQPLPKATEATGVSSWGRDRRFPITEALRLSTVAEVNAPWEPYDETANKRRSGSRPLSSSVDGCHENHDPSSDGVARGQDRLGRLDKVVLHSGDISRLRVDATVVGAVRSFKTVGDGRGFTGCSALLEGAGPFLSSFVSQQRRHLGEELLHTPVRGDPSSAQTVAAAAVRGLRRGIHHFTASTVPLPLRSSSTVPSLAEVEEMPIMELSQLAARAALLGSARGGGTRGFGLSSHPQTRRLEGVSTASGATEGSDAALSFANEVRDQATASQFPARDLIQTPLDPSQLSPPGAVLISPGFNLPSNFLIHVAEPNAVLSNQQMLDTLFRLEEREALRRKEQLLSRFGAAQAADEAMSDDEVREEDNEMTPRSMWQDDAERDTGVQRMLLLEECYINALNAAWALGVRSVALPCLGAGVGRFPVYIAARCAARGVARWMSEHRDCDAWEDAESDKRADFDRIVFCTSSDVEWNALRRVIPQFLS